MANKKCGLHYCGVMVADYDYAVNVLECPCLKCFGTKCDECDIYKNFVKTGIDLQREKCSKCTFYNGR